MDRGENGVDRGDCRGSEFHLKNHKRGMQTLRIFIEGVFIAIYLLTKFENVV